MKNNIIVIGGGIAGLTTAIKLAHDGNTVTLYERMPTLGGRLNVLHKNGYKFDTGPSFLTMTYVYRDFFKKMGENLDKYININKLDPNFTVKWKTGEQIRAYGDIALLKKELDGFEDTKDNLTKYLALCAKRFHASFDPLINSNINSVLDYIKIKDKSLVFDGSLTDTVWENIGKYFNNDYIKMFFSLESFYLGMTPYKAPAIFTLLNYTDLIHDGIWRIEGGMYKLTDAYVQLAKKKGVKLVANAELNSVEIENNKISTVTINKKKITADAYVITSDLVQFYSNYLPEKYAGKFSKLRAPDHEHTMGLFTLYIGAKKKWDTDHHTYILGKNFKEYISKLFDKGIVPENPYYYVTNASRYDDTLAPKGSSSIFVLVPVPTLLSNINWKEKKESFTQKILTDLEQNGFAGIKKNIEVLESYSPVEWEDKFNLYKGSGLGLSHGLNQLGPLRPKNYHSKLTNLFFAGASTTPGTGLPMVTISGQIVCERIYERLRWN